MDQSEVRINTIHSAVGAINETDVVLADASNAIIIGFGVRPDGKARSAAAREGDYIPDWACAAVSSLTSCGVYPAGSDCAASLTRAEAAQMLLGAYELLQKR